MIANCFLFFFMVIEYAGAAHYIERNKNSTISQ